MICLLVCISIIESSAKLSSLFTKVLQFLLISLLLNFPKYHTNRNPKEKSDYYFSFLMKICAFTINCFFGRAGIHLRVDAIFIIKKGDYFIIKIPNGNFTRLMNYYAILF